MLFRSGRGAFYNNQTGIRGTAGKTTIGNVDSGKSATVGHATVYNPNTGKTTHISGGQGSGGGSFVNVNGHVIAGNNGNYYRPDGQGGWNQITKPTTSGNSLGAGGAGQRESLGTQQQWRPSNIDAQQRQSLDNQFGARQWGAQREQSFAMNRPSFRGGGFGGFGRRR